MISIHNCKMELSDSLGFSVMKQEIAKELAQHVFTRMDAKSMSTYCYIQLSTWINEIFKDELGIFFEDLDTEKNEDMKKVVSYMTKKILSNTPVDKIKKFIIDGLEEGYQKTDKAKVTADIQLFAPHLLTKYKEYLN